MKKFYTSWIVISAALVSPVAGQLALPDTLYRQGAGGLPDSSEASDKFGSSIASGDFDNDGFPDVAIGVFGENSRAGAVQVIYGSADGLDTARQVLIRQSDLSPAHGEGSEAEDQFGKSVASGDFDGDGVDDLAIGAPLEHVGAVLDTGAVSVIYGVQDTGLDLTDTQYWTQDSTGITDTAENGDQFGWSLAAGDFNGDLRDDLAIGVHKESLPGAAQAGAVQVILGGPSGLTSTGNLLLTQTLFGLSPESAESFGWALAVGRFDVDSYDDLAIGTPADTLSPSIRGGSVLVVFGSSTGLQTADSALLTRVPYVEADNFGFALAAGRFNGDTFDDLAVGAPGRDHPEPPSAPTAIDSGRVYVYYGSSSKANFGTSSDSLRQGIAGIAESPEVLDNFGRSLASGRYADGGGELDYLAIGVPLESIDGVLQAGAVHVLYPSASGVASADLHQLFHQNVADFSDSCEAGDLFGLTLGAGDFNNDGQPDLVIGVPEEDIGAADTGVVHLIEFPSTLQDIFDGDFETSDTSQWTATCPETCS